MGDEPLSVKRRYLHDLIGTRCSIVESRPVLASSCAFGRGKVTRLSPPTLLAIISGAVGKSGVSWVKAKGPKSGVVWLKLSDLTCI